MKKTEYKMPLIAIAEFDSADIITTSGGYELKTNFNDHSTDQSIGTKDWGEIVTFTL